MDGRLGAGKLPTLPVGLYWQRRCRSLLSPRGLPRPRFTTRHKTRALYPLLSHWRHVTGNPYCAQATDFDDSAWSQVDLPHSYNAADGADGHGYYRGPAWYRTTVTVPAEFTGKEVFLQFDDASFVTDVYIDGEQAGPPHRGGFSQFNYDVTPKLSPGSHLIAVKVDNSVELEDQMPPQGGDYTKSGGIYRGVRLIAVDPTHVALSEYLEDTKHAISAPGRLLERGQCIARIGGCDGQNQT